MSCTSTEWSEHSSVDNFRHEHTVMDVSMPMPICLPLRGKKLSLSSNVLTDTANQVTQQLSIVRRLREQNAPFLDDIEKAWVDHVLKSSALAIDATGHPTDSGPEVVKPRRRWMPDGTFFLQMRQLLKESPAATDDLTQLLVAAKCLNSAIGLLSCCYDRWKWCQGIKDDQQDASLGESNEPENGPKQTPVTNRLIRLASVCLREGRTMTNEQELDDRLAGRSEAKRVSAMPEDTPGESEDSGRHERLSLVIIETVEKWRQNAEDALGRTSSQSNEEESMFYDFNASVIGLDFGNEDGGSSVSRGSDTISRPSIPGHSAPPSHNSTSLSLVHRANSPTRTANAGLHQNSSDKHDQLSNSSTPSKYQMPRRKPVRPQTSKILTSLKTNATESSHTRSSSSPIMLFKPASISMRNSYDKEVVRPDNTKKTKTSISSQWTKSPEPKMSQILVSSPLQPSSQLQTKLLMHSHENLLSLSVSPCSSQATLAPAVTNLPLSRPSRISRGRAWLERQAENSM